MKNIEELLTEAGVKLPEDKKAAFDKAFGENYKTIADYQRQADKLKAAEDKAKTAEDGLKAFDGVDVGKLKEQITALTKSLKDKDEEHAKALDERDLADIIGASIRAAKGRDEKAIRAHLDMDVLRTSKDRQRDVAAAIEVVKKEHDFLFEPDAPQANGNKLNVGGGIRPPEPKPKKQLKNIY